MVALQARSKHPNCQVRLSKHIHDATNCDRREGGYNGKVQFFLKCTDGSFLDPRKSLWRHSGNWPLEFWTIPKS